jgi:hypothetical protein
LDKIGKRPPPNPTGKGGWVKGQSGNPTGMPPGFSGRLAALAEQIGQETNQGAELVAFALETMRDPETNRSDRLHAHSWLADRLWGKSPQDLSVHLTAAQQAVQSDVNYDALSLEELDLLERLHLKALGQGPLALPAGEKK